jgi:CxxC-x17-CxxC domain-containing protein
MRKFNDSGSFGKRDSRPPRRSSGGRTSGGSRFGNPDRSEPRPSRPAFGRSSTKSSGFELHEVTCDKCGVKCDIPFKPTNNKPVYCRACFRKNEITEPRAGPDRFESRGRDRFESKPRFEEFKQPSNANNASPSSEDLDKINRKLDKIMKALKIE